MQWMWVLMKLYSWEKPQQHTTIVNWRSTGLFGIAYKTFSPSLYWNLSWQIAGLPGQPVLSHPEAYLPTQPAQTPEHTKEIAHDLPMNGEGNHGTAQSATPRLEGSFHTCADRQGDINFPRTIVLNTTDRPYVHSKCNFLLFPHTLLKA